MYKGKYFSVMIAAGGMGTRFGSSLYGSLPKQFLSVGSKSMIMASAEPFLESGYADEIIFVVPTGYLKHTCGLVEREMKGSLFHAEDTIEQLKVSYGGNDTIIKVVYGGEDRTASVKNGLKAIGEGACQDGLVLIHDAARPFVSNSLILRVLEAAYEYGAAVPVTHVNDTVYVSSDDGFIAGIPDRKRLRMVQTPQGFDLSVIREANSRVIAEGISPTDDGAPVFTGGKRVAMVEGDTSNIKITLPEDLSEASASDAVRGRLKVGIGFDAHRFTEGRALVIGGVNIPHDKGLSGHSDADVLTHALMDAILGALNEGDIGILFPDTDPLFAGISSMALLSGVVSLMNKRGYEIGNVDLTVVAEKPRMAPYYEKIEQRLAGALGTDPLNVSLKATTTEKLGFTGREEGIAAEALVLLKDKQIPKGGVKV